MKIVLYILYKIPVYWGPYTQVIKYFILIYEYTRIVNKLKNNKYINCLPISS